MKRGYGKFVCLINTCHIIDTNILFNFDSTPNQEHGQVLFY